MKHPKNKSHQSIYTIKLNENIVKSSSLQKKAIVNFEVFYS